MSILDRVTTQQLEETPDYYLQFPVGECPAQIVEVTEEISKNGREMVKIVFENDESARISYYLVEGDFFLRQLKSLLTAFRIPFEEKNTWKWLGKKGVVVTKLSESYNGKEYPKVSYVRSLKNDENTIVSQTLQNEGF